LISREVPTINTIVERLNRFLQFTISKSQIAGKLSGVVPAKTLCHQPWSGGS
jgi:hypothetical protein